MNDNKSVEQLADAIVEDSTTAKCGHWVECGEICEKCYRCLDCCDCCDLERCGWLGSHPFFYV